MGTFAKKTNQRKCRGTWPARLQPGGLLRLGLKPAFRICKTLFALFCFGQSSYPFGRASSMSSCCLVYLTGSCPSAPAGCGVRTPQLLYIACSSPTDSHADVAQLFLHINSVLFASCGGPWLKFGSTRTSFLPHLGLAKLQWTPDLFFLRSSRAPDLRRLRGSAELPRSFFPRLLERAARPLWLR